MGKRGSACLRHNVARLVSILFILSSASLAFARSDVTDSIELIKGRLMANRATMMAYLDVGLRNIGATAVQGPLIAVIDSVSTDQVTVENEDGTTDDGKPYYIYDGELGDGILDVQETSSNKRWTFHNPKNLRFSYSVVVLAGPEDETAPNISFTNPLEGAVTSNSKPLITIEFSDEGSGIDAESFLAEIDGQNVTANFTISETGATCQIASPLGAGSHHLEAGIADQDGNATRVMIDFEVKASTQPLKYLFSVTGSDWIFASPGDGTCVEYYRRQALGLNAFSEVTGLSQVLPTGGDLYFVLKNQEGILKTPLDGTNSIYQSNSQLGLTNTDRLASLHVGIDGKSIFSVQGISDLLQSEGAGANAFYMQNTQLGLSDANLINCLHIGYDNTIYLCHPDGTSVLRSIGDGTNSTFLTATALGVPNAALTAFAILPETTPPQLTITNPIDGAFVNTATPNFSVAFSDKESGIAAETFYAELDSVDITSLFTITGTSATYQVAQGNALSVGNHSLNVQIQDRVGNQNDASSDFSIGILRALPSATPTSGASPLTVVFSANGEDPAGTIEVFRWDFDGNGSWDSYDTVARDYTRTYNTPGTYNAVLYVQSSTGDSATASIVIKVVNNPPVATADAVPSNGEVPLAVQLTGTGSDVDGSIVLYEWDFNGDGTFEWSSPTSGNTSYTYTDVGTYQAVFRVTDNSGLTDTATATTTAVRAGPPGSPTAMASASPSAGNAPLNVNFTGTATDPNNNVVLYEWDFDNDGTYDFSSTTSGNTSHTYTQAGTHVATFRVTDATGLSGIDQILITVNIQASLSVQSDTVGWLASSAGMTARASSQYSTSYSPDKAIDGQTNTYWYTTSGGGTGSWFEVSFDTPQILSGLNVQWNSYRMTRARIDVYDNSGTIIYTEEHDFPTDYSQVTFPELENVSRIKLSALSVYYYYYVSITELKIDSSPMPNQGEPEPTGTNINTSISAGSPVTIFIKDQDGNTVRTLANNEYRDLGTYSDYWDCKDDAGVPVHDGVYHAVMQYVLDGQVKTVDLTDTTGGTRYDFPISSGCNTRSGTWSTPVSPFDDEQMGFQFTLCSAQEVTFFIGPLWSGADQTRIRTILNRQPFPAGTHTIFWDGLDDNGNIAVAPAGDSLITGAWRYNLSNNAMFMTGGSPFISKVTADPNYFSPFSEKCDENGNGEGVVVSYTVSENVASVELRVYSVATGSMLRTINFGNASAGDNVIFWDGKNNSGEYVDIGDYRIGIKATDSTGNESMFKYTLVRIDY